MLNHCAGRVSVNKRHFGFNIYFLTDFHHLVYLVFSKRRNKLGSVVVHVPGKQ